MKVIGCFCARDDNECRVMVTVHSTIILINVHCIYLLMCTGRKVLNLRIKLNIVFTKV